jgi:hypothetical protein
MANETKFLELFINNNLSWNTHVECIKSQLRSACYVMQPVKPYIDKYSENDLLFLLPLCNGLWFVVLGALLREYKDFQVAKEDYLEHDGL